MELKENERFVFLHPAETLVWDGDDKFIDDEERWWTTRDLQEFGDTQIKLSSQNLDYRPAILRLKPEEVTEGPNKGKWSVVFEFQIVKLHWED
jgi:hypothetical protein